MLAALAFAAVAVATSATNTNATVSATSGQTHATLSSVRVMHGRIGEGAGPTFDLTGHLVVRYRGAVIFNGDPWSYALDEPARSTHRVDDYSAVSLDAIQLGALADTPQAVVIVKWSACGASCSQNAFVLAYGATTRRYAAVTTKEPFDNSPQAIGLVKRMPDGRDVLETTTPGPFDDCQACGPATVPLLLRVSGGALVDVASQYPRYLNDDAYSAWQTFATAYARGVAGDPYNQTQMALDRYLADESRLGNGAKSWQRARAAYRRSDAAQIFRQIAENLKTLGFVR